MTIYTPQPVLPSRQVPQHSSKESNSTLAPPTTPPVAHRSEHQNFEPIASRPAAPESIEQAHAAQTMHRAASGEKYARQRGRAGLPAKKTNQIQSISSISTFTSRDDEYNNAQNMFY